MGHARQEAGATAVFSRDRRQHPDPRTAPPPRNQTLERRSVPAFKRPLRSGVSEIGRPSIRPERLMGARLLAALFSVPSDRAFCERLRYDLLFQWILDLELEEEPFEASTFSENQQRLLAHQVADEFFTEVDDVLRERNLLSEEHFSVDGTLIET